MSKALLINTGTTIVAIDENEQERLGLPFSKPFNPNMPKTNVINRFTTLSGQPRQ